MNPGALFVLGILAVIAVAGISFYLQQKRRDELAAVAKRLGLTYAREDTANGLALPFALFRKGDGRGTENLLAGTWNGLAVREFDYWYYDESTDANGNRSRSYSRFSCAATSVDAAFSPLSIARENVLTRLADSVGLDDVQFELEDFNRAFNVKSGDPRFANAFVDQRMMRWLMTSPRGMAFETSGPWLLVWCHRVAPADIPGVLETLKGFREQIPRVVFDLFGPGG